MNVPHKYGVVRAIAFVLKILAWLVLLAGIVTAIVAATAISNVPGPAAGLLQIVRSAGLIAGPLVGIVWFVQLFAFGSILSLLIDIEENTRLLAAQPAAYPAPVDVA
jgi:hypothetical protein